MSSIYSETLGVIVGNLEIKEEHINIAKENKVNIIRTHYDTFHTAKLIGLSNYVKNLLTDTRTISFNENDYYDEFKEIAATKPGFIISKWCGNVDCENKII